MLAGISKTAYYYEPAVESEANLLYMEMIDKLYTQHPYYGSRRMVVELRKLGHSVNRKRVRRLMQSMGIEAIYPKPKLSTPGEEAKKYPYLVDLEKRDFSQNVGSKTAMCLPRFF